MLNDERLICSVGKPGFPKKGCSPTHWGALGISNTHLSIHICHICAKCGCNFFMSKFSKSFRIVPLGYHFPIFPIFWWTQHVCLKHVTCHMSHVTCQAEPKKCRCWASSGSSGMPWEPGQRHVVATSEVFKMVISHRCWNRGSQSHGGTPNHPRKMDDHFSIQTYGWLGIPRF